MIKHIVLLKFKPETDPSIPGNINRKLQGLSSAELEILDYHWGASISEEKRDLGFSHGFIMTFKDPDSLERYLLHHEHKKVASYITARVEEVLVFDLPVSD